MASLEDFLGITQAEEVTAAAETWPERIKHLSATSIAMFRRC